MIEENFVIEKEEKTRLFHKCLNTTYQYIKMCSNKYESVMFNDALASVHRMLKNRCISYQDAFFISLAINAQFLVIKDKVEKGELNLEHIKDEEYWNRPEITDIHVCIFFSYTFLNELYRDELIVDYAKLNELNSDKEYLPFREYILSK